jgi:hypothetical protein
MTLGKIPLKAVGGPQKAARRYVALGDSLWRDDGSTARAGGEVWVWEMTVIGHLLFVIGYW